MALVPLFVVTFSRDMGHSLAKEHRGFSERFLLLKIDTQRGCLGGSVG